MTKSEQAIEYFKNGYNCAQSVLAPFAENLDISEDKCLKTACAFGAGMGRQQYTCGAVTGAIMALGLRFGRGSRDGTVKKFDTYEKTVAFFDAFCEKHGSTCCLELLDGLRMNDPEDMKKIEQLDLHRVRCAVYVKDAVEMTENMLQAG